MEIKKLKIVRFAPKGDNSFYENVIAKVNAYFESNKFSPYANTAMWIKTFLMLLLYFAPFVLIITSTHGGNLWIYFTLWFVMGLGMVGIGTSVMHDANHGAYSPNKNVNATIGHILEVLGGYSVTWKIQHNILHHTYTNIAGLDEDIDSIRILRFSPRQPLYKIHRYQYLYVWFFYMIMTLFWMTAKDFYKLSGIKNTTC